jgi:hypothetical protein
MLRHHRREGWALHVRVWVVYTPVGGNPRRIPVTIRVLAAKRDPLARALT